MKSVSEVKVGALTLGGAVLLAGMISFLGAFSLFDSGYDLHVTYPSVNGLLTGGQVRYAGVPVGTVKDMKVDGSHVVVTMHVKKEVQIPMDSSFSIGSDGVMGEKFVQIQPPERASGVFVKPGSNLTGTPGGGLDEFMNSSGKVMEKVEGVASVGNGVFASSLISVFAPKTSTGMPTVECSGEDGKLHVSVHLSVFYGYPFTKLAADVRQAVNAAVEEQIGVPAESVDVCIDNLVFPKE